MSTLLGDARIRIRPDLTGFETAAKSGIGSSFARIGKLAGVTLGAAGVAAFAASTLNIGKTYQSTLNNLQAVSQASASQMAAVSREAKALGSDLTLTSTSAADAATAMTELAKGGLTVDQAMKAAKGTLQLAAAAGIGAAEAATLQSAALNAFNLEANQAGRVADVLANAANAAAGEITDFGQGMAQASAVAAATGISLEDTAATLGLLANNGIKGADAGTLLKSALLALQSPSEPASAAMRDLALSAYDASGNFVGLSSVFGQLAEAQKRMTPQAYAAATSTLFGSDAARLAGIAGREGAEGFDLMAEAMGRSGSAAEVAAAKAKGVDGAIESFVSTLETVQIDIFEEAAPVLEKLIRSATGLVTVFADVVGVVSDIPGPVYVAVGALVAWRLAGERITGAFSTVRTTFKGLREDAAVQQALFRQQAVSANVFERSLLGMGTGAATAGTQLSAAQMTMRGWDPALAATSAQVSTTAASVGRFTTSIALLRSAGAGLLSVFGGPVGLAITGVSLGLGFLSSQMGKTEEATEEATEAQRSFEDALRATNGVIDQSVRRAAAKAAQDKGLLTAARNAGVSTNLVTEAILGNEAAYTRVSSALKNYSYNRLIASGYEEHGKRTLHDQADAAVAAVTGFDDLVGVLPDVVAKEQDLVEATAAVTSGMGGGVEMTEEAIAALEKWRDTLASAVDSFVDPLGTYKSLMQEAATATAEKTSDASDSWSDYVDDVDVSLDELADRLEEQLQDQANWRTNLGLIAQWAGTDVAQHLAAMGEEGVGLVADMADGTGAEAQRMADLLREKISQGGAGAVADFDNYMKIMAAVGREGGANTAYEVSQQLGIGLAEVSRIARLYGVELAGGINPVLSAIGKRSIVPQKNDGRTYFGVQPEFMNGGYTGDGPKDEPKGVVHGGEFVFTKEETARAGRERLASYARSLRGYAKGGFVTEDDVPRPFSTSPYGIPISTAADGVMQKGYEDVTAWVRANAEAAAQGGTAGAGAIGGAWGSIWQYVKSRVPLARINSTFRRGDPGYHGKNKAIDFGYGSGPGGAGSAGLALINRVLHDGVGKNLAELIYDGIGDDRPDLKNGHPLAYSAATRAAHRNHVHAAVYDSGGVLEPGMTLVDNRSRKPEGVLNNDQLGWLQQAASGGSAPLIGGDLVLQVDPAASIHDQMETAMHEIRRLKRGGRGR